jgi:N-acetylglutamate synthase-like GNAT family acetyltransferase
VAYASAAEFPKLRAALAGASLPHEDLDPAAQVFLVVRDHGTLVATIGLERWGDSALLRSLWVEPARRGEGIAILLCRRLFSVARSRGVADLFLLTTTARSFFERVGFRVVDCEEAPLAMQGSAQFRSLCPSTATCMARSLREEVVDLPDSLMTFPVNLALWPPQG